MAFLASIEFERTQPCLANPERMIIVGRPSRELTPVLPYLAGLPNLLAWNPSLPSVTLRRAEGFITLTNLEVLITQVEDIDEGVRLLTVLADAINATWDRREELVAMQRGGRPRARSTSGMCCPRRTAAPAGSRRAWRLPLRSYSTRRNSRPVRRSARAKVRSPLAPRSSRCCSISPVPVARPSRCPTRRSRAGTPPKPHATPISHRSPTAALRGARW